LPREPAFCSICTAPTAILVPGDPEAFYPERFASWNGSAYNFITQGCGDPAEGHRCPGQGLTIELLKVSLRMLTRQMEYAVPAPDLRIDPSRMPAQPESRWVISDVRARLSGHPRP